MQAQHDTQLKSHSSGVLMPELPHATGSRAAEGLDPPQDKGLNPKGLPRLLLSACCTLTLAQAVVDLGRLQELLPPVPALS